MAGRRGFEGRSRDDLFAEAESITDMLAQLKGGTRGRGSRPRSRPSARPPHHAPWRPDPAVHHLTRPEWVESAGRPEGPRRPGRNWGRRGPGRPPRNYYPLDPPTQEKEWPREPSPGPRGQQHDRGNPRQQPPRGPGLPVTAQRLVEVLIQSQGFSVSLLNLMEQHYLPPPQVRIIVATHGHMFHIQEEVVSLALRLKLCAAHSGLRGCESREVCDSLHMCPKYVLSWCDEGEACVLGHRWHTDHNLAILKRLSMQFVRYNELRELLRRSHGQGQKGERLEAGPLEVCKAYNKAGCDHLDCPNLHVCLSFVVGLTICTRDNCQLKHNLLSPDCCHLLKLHHLPINEAPRDVAMALLLANPGLRDKAGTGPSAKPRPSKAAAQGRTGKGGKDAAKPLRRPGGKKDRTPAEEESEENSSATETDSESDDSDSQGNKRRGTKGSQVFKAKPGKHGSRDRVKTRKSSAKETESKEDADDRPDKNKEQDDGGKPEVAPKPAPRRTLWAHYLHGDVDIPQICYYSVETKCEDEASGCKKLHAPIHFHWQVKEQAGRWTNLHSDQVTCIERAFCDPALENVNLPRLDPSKLDPSVSGLLILLGRDIWQADFSTNTLTNSAKSTTLQLRRLCTEPVVGQSIQASTYHWYFLDINKKWVKYGNVDTSGKQQLISSITSADIENHYMKTPQQPLNFKNSSFTFVLDLTAMKQTNQLSGTSREVRRRPELHLSKEEQEENKAKEVSDLPSHWDAMQPEERSRMVTLGPASDEYKKLISLLGNTVTTANIVQVDRIQNPFMWRALQNKIRDMTALYKSESLVNVRQLFHGTSHNAVAKICSENFDWRLHGTSTGQAYGRGTYFGINPGISFGYCRPGPNGLKNIFVARVAVGSIINGNPNMARPPDNPATSMLYDSTVDNTANPSMVVKYSQQECYPEYLITFT
ncbi:Poly [ADP-ribose] polymerase 12 [Chionoecetes opilio]|uniref:Poly [ADP-ribose] polymerase n=1 Tax=Chionoecetes opilio TaxID=41210 RepID=A0A8J4YAH0_CHIOP|nr:Poly [ADP-ribose] polymerase 12 [Chionoecetes opilio]